MGWGSVCRPPLGPAHLIKGDEAVLTEVKAYSAWASAPTLLLDEDGFPGTDLLQVRNIVGLDPVKAAINTTPFGSVDGSSFVGSSVVSRNIVITLRPNPDWDIWDHSTLRRLVYQYFMPQLPVRLVFESDDMDPVEIFGIVESCEDSQFSKDPEIIVSVVCPYPYFRSVNPVVVTGQADLDESSPTVVTYEGNVQTGIKVKLTHTSGSSPTNIGVRVANSDLSYLRVDTSIDANKFFELSSVPMNKYIQNVNIGSGVIDNLLSVAYVEEGSIWPHLHPGENEVSVITDQGVQDWELTYYKLYGGL